MKLKPGVSLRGCKWQVWLMSIVVDDVYKSLGYGEVVLTSGSDGKHKHPTHGLGYAADYRNRDVPSSKREALAQACRDALLKRLGSGYQFIVETNPDHNHGEYDPRAH